MKYYLIAGEASGDLHASRLMRALRQQDPEAEFRFFGGDLMSAVGGTCVKHYRELAYMGVIPVLLHLPAILRNMRLCRRDILAWQPHVVILVDYPGFNLKMARFLKTHTQIPVYYYIAPKIWAWKEYRIKNIRRDVDELFSILPFEVDFFEKKHHYPIHYVGNPTADEVREWRHEHRTPDVGGTVASPPAIALLCGSRKQEIRANLPAMLEATDGMEGYRRVIAGAPGIEPSFYEPFLQGHDADLVFGETYALLSRAHVALVTSGTATLETALFGVPQVVCYAMSMPWLVGLLRPLVLKIPYVSLVNLIAAREVVTELVADRFSVERIRAELQRLLDGSAREAMLRGYEDVRRALGDKVAPEEAAAIMYHHIKTKY